jgi:cytochrome c oxidase assembly factor CtaG
MHPVAGIGPVAVVPPSAVWGAWTFDPVVVAGLAAAAGLYARGWAKLLRARGAPQGAGSRRGHQHIRPRQAVSFFAGLALLAAALVSPLDALADTLLSVHMAQHLILLMVAPPLLVYGRPGLVTFLGLPASSRAGLGGLGARRRLRQAGTVVLNPLVVLVATVAALWGWHLPGPYQAAITHPALHAVEHLTFLVSALAFWALVIDPGPRRRLGYGPAILLVFATMLAGAALGALITFSSTVLYPLYGAGARLWGTTPLADQQVAGALMWIPPGAVLFLTVIVLALRWFEDVDRRVRAAESAVVTGTPLPSAGTSSGSHA